METKKPIRKRVVYLLLAFIYILIGLTLLNKEIPFAEFPDDFSTYWASGHMLISGEDPYSPMDPMELKKEFSFREIGIFRSYFLPPWTLPIFIPMGAIPYRASRLLWIVITIFILLLATRLIWNLAGGPKDKGWIPLVCVLSLSPAILALMEGQVTPFILLGITGFLYFEKRQKWFAAGCFLALATFKPHILYLFWFALLFWIARTKRWAILLGLFTALAAMTMVVMIIDRDVIVEYMRMNSTLLPRFCNNPTLSSILCLITHKWAVWQLLIAPAFGLVWLIYYWNKEQVDWNWQESISVIMFVCLITAPYAWLHDGLLFLVPVISVSAWFITQGFSRRAYLIVAAYFLANLLVFALLVEYRINQIIFIWFPIFFLLLYLLSINKSFLKSDPTPTTKSKSASI